MPPLYLHSTEEMEHPIVVLELSSIHPMFPIEDVAYMNKVRQSMSKDGLRFPLVILDISIKDWEDMYRRNITLSLPCHLHDRGEEERVYGVWRGNNRYRVAKELQYKLIDCVVVDSVEEAERIGNLIFDKGKQYV